MGLFRVLLNHSKHAQMKIINVVWVLIFYCQNSKVESFSNEGVSDTRNAVTNYELLTLNNFGNMIINYEPEFTRLSKAMVANPYETS